MYGNDPPQGLRFKQLWNQYKSALVLQFDRPWGGNQQAPDAIGPIDRRTFGPVRLRPFADVSLTECSMTLCGQRDSVATQVVPMRSRLPVV
jgi:hypothetical protein